MKGPIPDSPIAKKYPMTDLEFRKIVGVPVGTEWPKKLQFTLNGTDLLFAEIQTIESRLNGIGYVHVSTFAQLNGELTVTFIRQAEKETDDPSVLLRKAIDQFEAERDETHALGTLLPATEELITQIRAWLGD